MLHHFELCWHACGRRAASSVAYASKQKQSPRLFSRNAIVPGNKCNLATVDLIKDFFFLTKTDNSTIAANTGQISDNRETCSRRHFFRTDWFVNNFDSRSI